MECQGASSTGHPAARVEVPARSYRIRILDASCFEMGQHVASSTRTPSALSMARSGPRVGISTFPLCVMLAVCTAEESACLTEGACPCPLGRCVVHDMYIYQLSKTQTRNTCGPRSFRKQLIVSCIGQRSNLGLGCLLPTRLEPRALLLGHSTRSPPH